MVYGPDNIIFDIQYGISLGYMLSLKNFTAMSKNTARIFKSLLLRSNSKSQALRYLKFILLKRTPLEIMTKIFLKIHGIYKDATKERQAQRNTEVANSDAFDMIRSTQPSDIGMPANQIMRSMSIAMANSGRNILPPQVGSTKLSNVISEQSEDKSRVFSGEVIIFQHEMVQLFSELIDMNALNYAYLKSIILEYIRCLQEFSLPSQPKLQTILWKFIWKNRDFIGLQNLLQYKVLSDSLELAQYLLQLGSKIELPYNTRDPRNDISTLSIYYEPAFDYGLNMLYRLKQYRDVFQIMIMNGKFARALDFTKNIQLDSWIRYDDLMRVVDGTLNFLKESFYFE